MTEEKKPTETSPKKSSTTPWKRSDLLETTIKIPGCIVRWCSPTQFQKKLSEGWEFVNREKDFSAPLPDVYGSQMDTRVRTRELVLMKLPVERKEARDKYYRDLSKIQMDSTIERFEDESNKLAGEHKSRKGSVYGKYSVEKVTEDN